MNQAEHPAGPTLVVGIGASAGGLEAFKALLSVLPTNTGMAYLLVQHLDPRHKSLLVELLEPCTQMKVTEADQGVELQPNTIYVIRPDTALAVRDGVIQLSEPMLHRGIRLPVDHLFQSLARDYRWRSVGVVLSGAGSDGCVGLRAIKTAGGLTVAQSPATTKQRGMPQSAIDTGLVDLTLDIADMPAALARFAALPKPARVEPTDESDAQTPASTRFDEVALSRLAAVLEAHLDFDLRVYKPGTIERRMLRRMTLSGFDDIESYFEFVREDHAERQTIVRDLLISVTEFFRDHEAFRALREMVIDPLVAKASPGTQFRIWVPACATGEEAYSIAIEFLDSIADHDKRATLRVFATDVDQDALAVGRTAIYPSTIAERVSERRLREYFELLGSRGYQVRGPLRDVVSFANHDLTKDPPFSRMDLVSCRNVLIYLTPEAQRHVLEVLHFALVPGGRMMLSTSESTGSRRELFSTLSKPQRIFTKVGSSRGLTISRSRARATDRTKDEISTGFEPSEALHDASGSLPGASLARRAVLNAWAPPTVISLEDGSLQFSHGELSPFLRFPQGDEPRLDISTLLRPHLATRARSALYRCRRNHEVVTVVSSHDDKSGTRTQITAAPVPDLGDGAVMLSFEIIDAPIGPVDPDAPASPQQDAVVDQLERELHATREDLRNTVEELETSNEELRSSNEESMSTNEELQSANEELEATTEELRSLNEELTTVNSQLREKVEQLEQAHDDQQNFFSSTKIATLFLDDQLVIKRFTPAATTLLGIDHADNGRFVGAIVAELLQGDLVDVSRRVLEELTPNEVEIQVEDGRWFSRHVLPYRTESRRIEGVVATFVDITRLKRATEDLTTRQNQQAVVARLGLLALREVSVQAFMDTVVREVRQTLGVDYCKILELQPCEQYLLLRAGVGWQEGLVGCAHVETDAASQAGYTLESMEPVLVDDLAVETRFATPQLLKDHHVQSGASCVIRDGVHHYGVLGVHSRTTRAFVREDADFLQAVASVVASAITRSQARICASIEIGVATILGRGGNLDEELFPLLVARLADALSVSIGELWWADGPGQVLSRRALEVVGRDRSQVHEVLSQQTIEADQSVIWSVYSGAHAIWGTYISHPEPTHRATRGRHLGLASGLAFPILLDGEVIGVVGLYSSAHVFAGRELLRCLEGVGRSIGSFVDKTRLEARERRLAAITECSHDAILSYDLDGQITEWLAGASELYGYTATEMRGQPLERIVPDDQRQLQRQVNDQIFAGAVVEPFETRRQRADGSLVSVSVRSAAIHGPDGALVGLSSTERDITQQKQVERELVAADRQKDEFLAMLGHELRNPLAAISSASSLLGPHCQDEPTLHAAHAVLNRQTVHMTTLLDGLLDVSRIIRGKIRLELELVDLYQISREVIADAQIRLAERALELRTELPDAPVWVLADRVRVAQIIDNVLSNAIKYTPDGGVITLGLGDEGDCARLVVSDTGVGIEEALLAEIFTVFQQAEQSLDRARGGLGLGLALVKSLTDMHGGSVEAHSAGLGKGATFVVCLPLADQAPEASRPGKPQPTRVSKVLIIEDNEDAAEMLRQLLMALGYEVDVALDGLAGIEQARAWAPHAILCDLGLPDGLSGYSVAEQLRADPRTRDMVVVAVSGYGRPEDKQRAREAGFDFHLTKPIDLAELERLLRGQD